MKLDKSILAFAQQRPIGQLLATLRDLEPPEKPAALVALEVELDEAKARYSVADEAYKRAIAAQHAALGSSKEPPLSTREFSVLQKAAEHEAAACARLREQIAEPLMSWKHR